jgi:hypothetical protein
MLSKALSLATSSGENTDESAWNKGAMEHVTQSQNDGEAQ